MAYFCPTLIIVGNPLCAVYINTFFEIFFEVEIRHACLWKMNCCPSFSMLALTILEALGLAIGGG
jgi:hypothetical protein